MLCQRNISTTRRRGTGEISVRLMRMLPVLTLVLVVGQPPAARAAGNVTVEVLSGRTFTGQLDARTSDERLWLRLGTNSVSVLRPIEWPRIVRLDVGGTSLLGEELPDRLAEVWQITNRPPQPGEPPDDAAHQPEQTTASLARDPMSAPELDYRVRHDDFRKASRVQFIRVDAYVANWNASPEVDGIVVEVSPYDQYGEVVPVHGTLHVELVGARGGTQSPRRRPVRLADWVRSVDPARFGPWGAVYRLPFQAVHPDFDFSVGPIGMVLVRLSVPGQGTFEATVSDARIRPYSAFRDHLQQTEGRRFLTRERTGS